MDVRQRKGLDERGAHGANRFGRRVCQRRHRYNKNGITMILFCLENSKPPPIIKLNYLNPNDTDYFGDTHETFEVLVKFDNLPAKHYEAIAAFGSDQFTLGRRRGEAEALRRHMSNHETMLLQVDQHGGSEIYRFDVSGYAEADAWLSKKCVAAYNR